MSTQYSLVRVQQYSCERLVPEHLTKNHACVQRHVLIPVPIERSEQDLSMSVQVLHRREAGTDLPSKQVVEYLDNILAGLKFEPANIQQ